MAVRTYYVDPAATGTGDGSSWTNAYTSLSSCEAARQADLVTAGDTMVINCRTSGANPADTTRCVVDGSITDSSHGITIQVSQTDRAVGKWDTSKYRMYVDSGWNDVLELNDTYVTVIGVQAQNTAAAGRYCFNVLVGYCTLIGCIATGVQDTGDYYGGIRTGYDLSGIVVIKCLSVANTGNGFWGSGTNDRWYNCVSVGNGQHGFAVEGYRTFNATNCYAGGNGANDCNDSEANTTFSLTTCASEDGTFGASTIAYSTSSGAYFTNVTAGSENVHISSSSSFVGAGTDLSGTFTTDIDGETITSWMIGCDQPSSSGSTYTLTGSITGASTLPIMIYLQHELVNDRITGQSTLTDRLPYLYHELVDDDVDASGGGGQILPYIYHELVDDDVDGQSNLPTVLPELHHYLVDDDIDGTGGLDQTLPETHHYMYDSGIDTSGGAASLLPYLYHTLVNSVTSGISTLIGNLTTLLAGIEWALSGAITGVGGLVSRLPYLYHELVNDVVAGVGGAGQQLGYLYHLLVNNVVAGASTLWGNLTNLTSSVGSRLRIYMRIGKGRF